MAGLDQPMSVRQISDLAINFEFQPHIALKYWLRTAETMLRESQIYEQEGNGQQAYLLLMRYASLVLEYFPKHPQAGAPEAKAGLKAATKAITEVVQRMESLKPAINARYISWQEELERRGNISAPTRNGSRRQGGFDPAVAGRRTTLAAADNSDLAVEMAHNEMRRRQTKRRATRQGGISEHEEQERRTAGLWDDWEAALSKIPDTRNDLEDDAQMQRDMYASRMRTSKPYSQTSDGSPRATIESIQSRPELPRGPCTDYRYPSIPKPQPVTIDNTNQSRKARSQSPSKPTVPQRPRKDRLEEQSFDEPPTRPEKSVPVTPAVSVPGTKESYTFKPSAYLENGKPLRTVFLPTTLREKFLQIAAPNTLKNLETCGMLCGTLVSNALFISHVVIPEQESTSDTCDTINESGFFDYCATEDLMVLGWIHTHPSQTCFMSSRDLHTHCGYQIMMAESIAIVCAPSRNPSWGVFRLTDPPGMPSILHCRKTGLFHPHEETNIYTDALRPGHVCEHDGLQFQLVDLRSK
ncbi:hypothetical protein BJ878DRAFT_520766 [Calycina marina]|uniref:MPN domain-containing protein n=1 Tax=Calycina marina TaxID=1763456 RepID=A0A9P7YXG1_9HELO|nr:hypothetical protein BJ878DRAFT_520766 [Calycina marina]